MNRGKAVDSTQEATRPIGPYTVYAAGGLFTQHELAEIVYKASRYSPGSGFDQMLTERELGEIIQRLRKNGTL